MVYARMGHISDTFIYFQIENNLFYCSEKESTEEILQDSLQI